MQMPSLEDPVRDTVSIARMWKNRMGCKKWRSWHLPHWMVGQWNSCRQNNKAIIILWWLWRVKSVVVTDWTGRISCIRVLVWKHFRLNGAHFTWKMMFWSECVKLQTRECGYTGRMTKMLCQGSTAWSPQWHSVRHLGVNKMLVKIRKRYYWVNSYNDIEAWCCQCVQCSSVKGPKTRSTGPMRQYNVGEPFEMCTYC